MKAVRALLALVALGTLVHAGPVHASSGAAAGLGGYAGSAAASGVHAFYNPEGLLPLPPPVDIGAPDSLASIASGPTTEARSSVVDPGDLLANPGALLALAITGYQPGTVPPYPYRAHASSSLGSPDDESSPAPGLDAKAHADTGGSSANATMPASVTPAVATAGSVSAASSTTIDGSTVTVHSISSVSNLDLLGLVHIGSIVTDLTAKSDGTGQPTMAGGTVVSGATALGQPITIDADGIHQGSSTSSSSDPLNAIIGGVTGILAGPVNDALGKAGIHISLAVPVQLMGTSSGQRGSDGLRIDLAFSDESVPGLTDLLKALPPVPNPIPGAPSVEDLIQVAKANHLTSLQIGRGLVTLAAKPKVSIPIVPATPAPTPAASTPVARVASSPSAPSAPRAASPLLEPGGVVEPVSDVDAAPIGAGIGAVALLALLAQPFIGDWLGRRAAAVVAGDAFTTCPWEER